MNNIPISTSKQLLWDASWLKKNTNHDNPKVRLWALKRLHYCYPEQALETARNRLDDSDQFIVKHALKTIGKYGDSSDIPDLRNKLDTEQEAIKASIIRTLGKLGDSDLLEWCEERLHTDPPPSKSIVSSIMEGLIALDTDQSEHVLWEVFENTRMELTSSTLLPYLSRKAEGKQYQRIIHVLLDKLANNVMIKPRRFRLDLQQHAGIERCEQHITDLKAQQSLSEQDIKELANALEIDLSSSELKTISDAIQAYNNNREKNSLKILGHWASEQLQQNSSISPHRKQLLYLLKGFSNPPSSLQNINIPGTPIQELFFLALLSWLHIKKDQDLLKIFRVEQEKEESPMDLYEYPGSFLLDKIVQLLSNRDINPGPLLQDLRETAYPYRKVKAMRILSNRKNSDAIPFLIDNLRNQYQLIRNTAESCLLQYGTKCLPPLQNHLNDQSEFSKEELLHIANLLRQLPVPHAQEIFQNHLSTFMEIVGPDPIISYITDLATDDLVSSLRTYMDEHPLVVGEQLAILSDLYDLDLPEKKQFLSEVDQPSNQYTTTPESQPFPPSSNK